MVSLELPERQKTVRNASYLGAVQDLADSGDERHMDVKAGLQRVCQVFITNAANVFLQEVHDENLLNEQVRKSRKGGIVFQFKFICSGLRFLFKSISAFKYRIDKVSLGMRRLVAKLV